MSNKNLWITTYMYWANCMHLSISLFHAKNFLMIDKKYLLGKYMQVALNNCLLFEINLFLGWLTRQDLIDMLFKLVSTKRSKQLFIGFSHLSQLLKYETNKFAWTYFLFKAGGQDFSVFYAFCHAGETFLSLSLKIYISWKWWNIFSIFLFFLFLTNFLNFFNCCPTICFNTNLVMLSFYLSNKNKDWSEKIEQMNFHKDFS